MFLSFLYFAQLNFKFGLIIREFNYIIITSMSFYPTTHMAIFIPGGHTPFSRHQKSHPLVSTSCLTQFFEYMYVQIICFIFSAHKICQIWQEVCESAFQSWITVPLRVNALVNWNPNPLVYFAEIWHTKIISWVRCKKVWSPGPRRSKPRLALIPY